MRPGWLEWSEGASGGTEFREVARKQIRWGTVMSELSRGRP